MRNALLTCLLAMLLVACEVGGGEAPPVTIVSPASGAPVSATVAVQVSSPDDRSLSRVDVYVRSKNSESRGLPVGSSSSSPFVISWYTPAFVNQAELELVAVGRDAAGNESESPAVLVRTQNSGVPNLRLLTAFSLQADPSAADLQTSASSLPDHLLTFGVLPPASFDYPTQKAQQTQQPPLSPQQSIPARGHVLEWLWDPYALGADGYGIYLATDLAGPYEVQRRQAATAGSGAQKYSMKLPNAKAGDGFYGAVTAITNGSTVESGFSNADAATFLPAQSALTPADNRTVAGGRPTFSWQATPGASGYLYYLYDRNPWERGAVLLYSNFPQSTDKLVASYPADRAALGPGTYWWWVAGVSFDSLGRADGFSFSDARSFTVP